MASEPPMYVTGSHTFTITDYSIVKDISNKSGIQSEFFNVGGYKWMIKFYPQGINTTVSNYISVYVKVLNAPQPVKAMYSIRMKNWDTGKWSTSTPASSELFTFASSGNEASRGYSNYLKRSDLEASKYLRDDTIEIKCTLWVPPLLVKTIRP